MATQKKKASSYAEKEGDSDVLVNDRESQVKFISKNQEYGFIITQQDENGNDEYHTDAKGNKKLPTVKSYNFQRIVVKDHETGKINTKKCHSFFIASKKEHGKDYERIVNRLNVLASNPRNKLYSEDDWFKERNPEAFRIAKERAVVEDERDSYKARVDELEKKLGISKK